DDVIAAPLDGVILRLPWKEGEFAAAGAELALVGDVRELIIEAEVNEDDIRRVRLARPVFVRLAGYDHVKVMGEVYEILPDADRATKGYTVRVKFAEATFVPVPGSKLRGATRVAQDVEPLSGMTAELGIVFAQARDRLVFPRQALTPENTVFVLRDGRVHETKVTLGLVNFSHCEAVSGLSADDVVVTSGVRELKDGMRVRAREKP
ncbi:MAG: HlyD family efflux transporter periplasmic adaptor subunit, partial [Planctomycetes bacterium]|nr:HlyD family efflux transporter periplasmic adaptor subunit [Planctomycetota bacterium]